MATGAPSTSAGTAGRSSTTRPAVSRISTKNSGTLAHPLADRAPVCRTLHRQGRHRRASSRDNGRVITRTVAGAALLAWVWLALLRGMFWRTDVRLPGAPAPRRWPSVAVVVPARDEAAILGDTMPTLVAQQYPGPLRVLLVDDNSADGTGALVTSTWPTVTVVDPGPPEP